jgi:hypothetical protein
MKMGKQSRMKRENRPQNSLVTHEPETPINWPDGHVRVSLMPANADECVLVWIHGRSHYLHATTARELYNKLHVVLNEYNEIAAAHGVETV